MDGVLYVVDKDNKKVAVQLSYDVFGEYLDDLIDGLIAESRKNDESIPWEEAVEQLREKGAIDVKL